MIMFGSVVFMIVEYYLSHKKKYKELIPINVNFDKITNREDLDFSNRNFLKHDKAKGESPPKILTTEHGLMESKEG